MYWLETEYKWYNNILIFSSAGQGLKSDWTLQGANVYSYPYILQFWDQFPQKKTWTHLYVMHHSWNAWGIISLYNLWSRGINFF